MATSEINTPTKHRKLSKDTEPYWIKINNGYRKALADGTWVAKSGSTRESIGRDDVSSYGDALKPVIEGCDREDRSGNSHYTLDTCISDYCKKLALENSAATAEKTGSRVRLRLPISMLDADVKKITTRQFNEWHKGMVKAGDDETMRKSKVSANRAWSMLRAALNHAYSLGIVDTDREWSRVKPFKSASTTHALFLTDKQVRSLLEHCDKHFYTLCMAAVLTGARYMELGNAKVRDLDGKTLTLSGKTGERITFLSTEGAKFLKKQAGSKLPDAPLLSAPNGGHWISNQQTRLMKAAIDRTKLPKETVFHSLRHYYISKAMIAGISVLAIAKNCGISVAMIEKHYGKFQPQDMNRLMDMVELA